MSNPTPLQAWALPHLELLIPWPLPDDELLHATSYAASLGSADEVAEHFKIYLGESADSLTFIAGFNSRLFSSAPPSLAPTPRTASPATDTTHPRNAQKRSKKGRPLNTFKQEPRRPNDGQEALFANPQGLYIKKDNDLEDEYYAGSSRKSTAKSERQKATVDALTPSSSSSVTPNLISTASYAAISKPAGKLTSDLLSTKKKPPVAAPKPEKYVYATTGGTSMRGATSELTDLESALRALEISTNPTLNKQTPAQRRCNCQGITHEVLQATPNCLSCGKIICIKEGLGPCTFCNTPLLSSAEVQDMMRSLREEAGREKMAINAAHNKRAEVAKIPRPFTAAAEVGSAEDGSLRKAQEHRDRLLGFQATSAQRTRIIDQAADFETPLAVSGLNQWATPAERALQLKRQQKTMRMIDWNAKEAYEKRKVVVAIDLKGRRVVREMREIEAPQESDDDTAGDTAEEYDDTLARGGKGKLKESASSSGGTFARNPLLEGLIKPVYMPKGKEVAGDVAGSVGSYSATTAGWRRVQDDFEDNERVILDGGTLGGGVGSGNAERGHEIPCR